MVDRFALRVTVPDVVGMPFHIGRDVAGAAGVALAGRDPDGPPIAALAWPGLFYITAQHPPAGTRVYEWDSVVVDVVEHGSAECTAHRRPDDRPPGLPEHAEPGRDQVIDLTDDAER